MDGGKAFVDIRSVFDDLRSKLNREVARPPIARSDARERCSVSSEGCSPTLDTTQNETTVDHSFALRHKFPVSTLVRDARSRVVRRRQLLQLRSLEYDELIRAMHEETCCTLHDDNVQFHNFAEDAHANAGSRLQALFAECTAEIEKAVVRVREASSQTLAKEEHECNSQILAKAFSFQYSKFLARLEADTREQIRTTLMYPAALEESACSKMHDVLFGISQRLRSDGPVVDAVDRIVVDAIAIIDSSKNRGDQVSRQSSLHFIDSFESAWKNITESYIETKPLPSSRKSRRPSPPTAEAHTKYTLRAGSTSGILRQLVGNERTRFSGLPVDTLLSCSTIRWLIEGDQSSESTHWLLDTFVYADLNELESSTYMESDCTALSPQSQQKSRNGSVTSGRGRGDAVVDDRRRRFVRATVLELLQTSHFHNVFRPLIGDDIKDFEATFPILLQRPRMLATLYAARYDVRRDATAPPDSLQFRFEPLESPCIHELCVVYLARGTRLDHKRRTITSLAAHDALSILPVQRSANAEQCVIRSPYGLLRTFDRGTANDPTLFVEYHIERTMNSEIGSQQLSKRRVALDLLGQVCSWRSCMDSATRSLSSGGARVCGWHSQVQTVFEDSRQFLPSIKEMRACAKDAHDKTEATVVNKMILKSSSLLEELSSCQLNQSISLFFDHNTQTMTNSSFAATRGFDAPNQDTEFTDESATRHADRLSDIQASLSLARTILDIEKQATRMIQDSSVDNLAPVLVDLEQLESDVRTSDYRLLLELSKKKMAILRHVLGAGAIDGANGSRMLHSMSDGMLATVAPPRETSKPLDARPTKNEAVRRPKSASSKRP